MTTITTKSGREIDYSAVIKLMDGNIIGDLGGSLSGFANLGYWDTLTAQQQFDEYSALHLEEFGVAFEPA